MSPQGEEIKLQISEAVSALMKEGHIYEGDVRQVIEWAESTGNKLYDPETSKFLAKKMLVNVTFYVIYSHLPEGYMIHTTYSHRSEIVGG